MMIRLLIFGLFFARPINGFQQASLSSRVIIEPTKLHLFLREKEGKVVNRSFEENISKGDQDPFPIQRKDTDDSMLYVMMALIFAIGSLSALDRVAMSVALVPMSEEMGYTDTVKGSISSLFSVGYGLGILPFGLLLATLSPRLIMSIGISLWSVGTLATPLAAAQANMAFLVSARALVGASESCVIPSVQKLLSNWVPPERKGLAVATVFAGFQTGTLLAYSLSPALIDQFGGDWRSLFFLYGGGGLLFLVPWLALAKESHIGLSCRQRCGKSANRPK